MKTFKILINIARHKLSIGLCIHASNGLFGVALHYGTPYNLKDIQDRMISKMSNTTRLVDKLILKGYVERFTCKKNRRKVEIFITQEVQYLYLIYFYHNLNLVQIYLIMS